MNSGSGSLSISNSSFLNNITKSAGGGIALTGGVVTLTGSTFQGNQAIDGGAIDNVGAAALLTNCTLTGNQALFGGAIFDAGGRIVKRGPSASPGVTTLVNVTIANNNVFGPGGGGGLEVGDIGGVNLFNTIVAQNTSNDGDGPSPDDIDLEQSGEVSGTFNLIGVGGSGGLMGGPQTGNQIGVADAGLASLADDGGPVETMALLVGSPAIDAGSNAISDISVPATDQRGALRGPAGLNAGPTLDVGAFEASSSYLVTTTDDSYDVGTLRAGVHWADMSTNVNPENLPDPAPNTVVFDTKGIFSTPQTITLKPFLFEQTLAVIEFEGTTVPEVVDGPGSGVLTISGGDNVQGFGVMASANASLIGLTITDGVAALGGAVINDGALTINDCVLSDNAASVAGGAIDNAKSAGVVTIIDSTIVDNSVPAVATGGNAGAILNLGTMIITNSTLSGNSAAELGGAIENVGDLSLANTTLSGNFAGQSGGAIDQFSGTLLTVNVTIAGNSVAAANSGGGLYVADGTAALYNTIVAANTKGTGPAAPASDINVVSPGTLSGSFNLVGTGGGGGLVNGANHNKVGVAKPLLGVLADNNGTTQTIAPFARQSGDRSGHQHHSGRHRSQH